MMNQIRLIVNACPGIQMPGLDARLGVAKQFRDSVGDIPRWKLKASQAAPAIEGMVQEAVQMGGRAIEATMQRTHRWQTPVPREKAITVHTSLRQVGGPCETRVSWPALKHRTDDGVHAISETGLEGFGGRAGLGLRHREGVGGIDPLGWPRSIPCRRQAHGRRVCHKHSCSAARRTAAFARPGGGAGAWAGEGGRRVGRLQPGSG